ncbi:MAG: phosphatase PAP2 family protein [Bacteroidota bacterium]
MLEILLEWDRDLLLFLNSLHAPWLDQVMYWISEKEIWIPFYVLIIGLIIREYKWKSIIYITGIILAIAATDQLCSGFMKPFFERFRPSRDPSLEGLVHIVNDYRGGKYGFASSHAGNTFALATFLFLTFKKRFKLISWMFLWAAVVSYSRIYLGVHYPGDILVGGLIGVGFGFIFYRFTQLYFTKFTEHFKKSND